MTSFKFLICIVLVLYSSAKTGCGRGIKPIGIAREALEVQFRRVLENHKSYHQPKRTSPGGPDPNHHFRHY
ncbi:hypothetical protein CsSME_00031842 [Camellia sinensis var. sinensis]